MSTEMGRMDRSWEDVTMDDAGVPLLTIDARDGSVIQRIQAGWAASMGSKDIK